MKTHRLCCPFVVAFVCFVIRPCVGQDTYLARIFDAGDHRALLDSLRQRPLAASERFFAHISRSKKLSPCDRVELARLHGQILFERNQPVRALEYADESRRLNKNCGSTHEEVALGLLLGTIYKSQGRSEEALVHFLNASKHSEELPPSPMAVTLYNSAALLHYYSGNFTECIDLLKRAIDFYAKNPDMFTRPEQKQTVVSALNTLALSYRSVGEYDKAIDFFRRSRAMALRQGNEFWVGLTHGNIGTVYRRMKQYDSAIFHLLIDTRISKKHQQWNSLVNAYLSLAEVSEEMGNPSLASRYYDSTTALVNRFPELTSIAYLQKQSERNYNARDYRASARYYRQLLQMKDSLDELKASNDLRMIQSRHEFDTKLAELALIRKENELKEKELAVQRGLLFGSISTVLLLFLLIYMVARRYQRKRRAAALLEQQIIERTRELTDLNLELDTFLYRASHDFRGPLATLMGLNHLGTLTVRDPEASYLLKKVGDVAGVMDRMLNKIAAIHIINREDLSIQPVSLRDLSDDILGRMKPQSADATIANDIPADLLLNTDPKLLGVALENVVENSLKFRKYNSAHTVSVHARRSEGTMTLTVSDTGKGIARSHYDRIFLPFVRADNEKGNGLGLFLARKCVEKLGGAISFESQLGIGTTFTIVLPADGRRERKVDSNVISARVEST